MSNVEEMSLGIEDLVGMTIEDTIRYLCKEVELNPTEEEFEKITKVALLVVPIALTAAKLQMMSELGEDNEHLHTRH